MRLLQCGTPPTVKCGDPICRAAQRRGRTVVAATTAGQHAAIVCEWGRGAVIAAIQMGTREVISRLQNIISAVTKSNTYSVSVDYKMNNERSPIARGVRRPDAWLHAPDAV